MGKRRDELDRIIQSVCTELEIRKSDLISRSMDARHVLARGLLALIVREYSNVTMTEVARRLKRDRTGLSSAAMRTSQRILEDEDLSERLHRILENSALQFPRSSKSEPTLRDRIVEHAPYTLGEAIDIICSLIDMISGLDVSQLPRCLNPESIIIHGESEYRITDVSGSASDLSIDSKMLNYLAPEIHDGDTASIIGIVWSLGVLLFELLTGRNPFPSRDTDTIPDVRLYKPDLPESVTLLLYRAWEIDPELRIQNPALFGRELRAILNELNRSSHSTRESERDTPESHEAIVEPVESAEEKRTKTRIRWDLAFVGRERELSEVRNCLTDPSDRLVSVVGPGGIGKSRFAYELANHVMPRYADGVYFIPLNTIHSPAFIPLAIGNSLGLTFGGMEEPLDQLISHIHGKRLLLVLDDFDRLLAGADTIARLIRETDEVDILVTSRARLNLRDEHVYEISGLDVPEENEEGRLLEFSSVRLFRDNASRLRTGYALNDREAAIVAQICRLLEGMPLAIELASGWIRVLTCDQILNEIQKGIDVLETTERDREERHRNMRATFDRSWRMLNKQEQRILSRLSVFRGGFDRNAADSIADTSLLTLRSLIEKSLIQKDIFGRYRMHELLRQYVEEKLVQDSREEFRSRQAHSRYYGLLLEQQNSQLRSKGMAEVQETISRDRANIDAGFEWAIRNDEVETATIYVEPLSIYFQSTGQFRDGDQIFSDALELLRERRTEREAADPKSTDLFLARVKSRLALQKGRLGQFESSRSLIDESKSVFETANERSDVYFCKGILANIARKQGRYKDAIDLWDSILVELGDSDPVRQARVMSSMASVYARLGDAERARTLYERTCVVLKDHDEPVTITQALNGLGDIALRQGLATEAHSYYEQALSIVREIGHKGLLDVTLDRLAGCAIRSGELQKAKRLYEEVLSRYRETGSESGIARGLYALGNCLVYLQEDNRARELLEDSVTLYKKIGEVPGEAYALSSLGLICQQMHDYEAAEKAYKKAYVHFEEISNPEGRLMTLSQLAGCYSETGNVSTARSYFCSAIDTYREFPIKARLSDILLGVAELFEKENGILDAGTVYLFVANNDVVEHVHRDSARNKFEALSLSPDEIQSLRRDISEFLISDILEFVLQRL